MEDPKVKAFLDKYPALNDLFAGMSPEDKLEFIRRAETPLAKEDTDEMIRDLERQVKSEIKRAEQEHRANREPSSVDVEFWDKSISDLERDFKNLEPDMKRTDKVRIPRLIQALKAEVDKVKSRIPATGGRRRKSRKASKKRRTTRRMK